MKTHYINKKDQEQMLSLIDQFYKESNDGETPTWKSEKIMNELFSKYCDKIIKGIISFYKFYQFVPDSEDLLQQARMHIYKSIVKKQYNPEKSTIFNFFSTVASNNLLPYTLSQNKDKDFRADQEIEKIYNENVLVNVDFDKIFIMSDFFLDLHRYFRNKGKSFQRILRLFEKFYYKNILMNNGKFVKKDFINYCKGFTYSSSLVNTFFAALRRIKGMKDLYLDE